MKLCMTPKEQSSTTKNVRIFLPEQKRNAKSQLYVEACKGNKCEVNETRSIIGRYKPVVLTKLNNESGK